MESINLRSVVLGGLLAGLVINVGEFILNEPLLGAQMEEVMAARNVPPVGGGAIGVFVLMGFIIGIASVWLYAAVRPRLGPGPKTAICVGLLVWFFGAFQYSVAMVVLGFAPLGMSVVAGLWGLVEMPLATLVGARMYSEG